MKNYLFRQFNHYREIVGTFFRTPAGKKCIKWFRYVLQGIIAGVILYQLSNIGWTRFLNALPHQFLFYFLFLVIYLLLPFSEALIYNICWKTSYFRIIPTLIKKGVYNKDLMGYSGELMLMQWAKKTLPFSGKKAFKDIRDVNIISSAASTFVALGSLALFIILGKIKGIDAIFNRDSTDYIFLAIIAAVILAFLFKFRSYFFSMPRRLAVPVFLIHATRMILTYGLQILQWHTVLPSISLQTWFTFLSVNIIISRIPLVPSNDLIATGANIEVAKILKAPVAAVAGLFLVNNVLDKLFNFIFYIVFTYSPYLKNTASAEKSVENSTEINH